MRNRSRLVVYISARLKDVCEALRMVSNPSHMDCFAIARNDGNYPYLSLRAIAKQSESTVPLSSYCGSVPDSVRGYSGKY